MQVNHKDGNRKNNNPHNLELVTPKGNTQHAITTGLRKTKLSQVQAEVIRQAYALGFGRKFLQEKYGVGKSAINDITRGATYK
jgi:hypothetical protein